MEKNIVCPACDGAGWTENHTCDRCHGTGNVKRPMTNGDRIRAMGDEELAAMLDAFCEVAECRTADGAVCPLYDNCPYDGTIGINNNAWAVWLQQIAKD